MEVRLKSRRSGSDARSRRRADTEPVASRLPAAGSGPLLAEQDIDLAAELSVLVARSPSGAQAVFPLAGNHHRDGVLETSVMPAMLDVPLQERASELALEIAHRLNVEGLLAVEMFLTRAGELLIKELTPRPHNAFHATELACGISQFEQLVRAVAGLPLGEAALRRPTAMANLFGDLWLEGRSQRLIELLHTQGVTLRLYDKRPHPGRKLGHLAFSAGSADAALRGVKLALRQLDAPPAV